MNLDKFVLMMYKDLSITLLTKEIVNSNHSCVDKMWFSEPCAGEQNRLTGAVAWRTNYIGSTTNHNFHPASHYFFYVY